MSKPQRPKSRVEMDSYVNNILRALIAGNVKEVEKSISWWHVRKIVGQRSQISEADAVGTGKILGAAGDLLEKARGKKVEKNRAKIFDSIYNEIRKDNNINVQRIAFFCALQYSNSDLYPLVAKLDKLGVDLRDLSDEYYRENALNQILRFGIENIPRSKIGNFTLPDEINEEAVAKVFKKILEGLKLQNERPGYKFTLEFRPKFPLYRTIDPSLLWEAVEAGHLKLVKLLVEFGLSVDKLKPYPPKTLLLLSLPHPKIAKYILKVGVDDIDQALEKIQKVKDKLNPFVEKKKDILDYLPKIDPQLPVLLKRIKFYRKNLYDIGQRRGVDVTANFEMTEDLEQDLTEFLQTLEQDGVMMDYAKTIFHSGKLTYEALDKNNRKLIDFLADNGLINPNYKPPSYKNIVNTLRKHHRAGDIVSRDPKSEAVSKFQTYMKEKNSSDMHNDDDPFEPRKGEKKAKDKDGDNKNSELDDSEFGERIFLTKPVMLTKSSGKPDEKEAEEDLLSQEEDVEGRYSILPGFEGEDDNEEENDENKEETKKIITHPGTRPQMIRFKVTEQPISTTTPLQQDRPSGSIKE